MPERFIHPAMSARTIEITGHNGDVINAYEARPEGSGPFPAVIVAHHMPGWDEWCMEVTRRFAHHGYLAIAPNLHYRQGPGTPAEASARVREEGGQNDAAVLGDLQGALDHLRALPEATGKVGIIGFCSGGRVAYMAGCNIAVDAAVDCWGGNVIPAPERINHQQPVPVISMTANLSCPLLGLFGNDDANPEPAQVDAIESELKKHGKQFEFHRYDGAGHAFFAWERASHRPEQAADAWSKVWAFYEKHLR
jgi:carboxymethylenebutenolidase